MPPPETGCVWSSAFKFPVCAAPVFTPALSFRANSGFLPLSAVFVLMFPVCENLQVAAFRCPPPDLRLARPEHSRTCSCEEKQTDTSALIRVSLFVPDLLYLHASVCPCVMRPSPVTSASVKVSLTSKLCLWGE